MSIGSCTECGEAMDAGAVACASCGARVRRELPPFFAVSVLKLAVMSISTLGLYELYWFYRNWQRIRVRENRDIKPSLRAFFALFFCYPCFREIRKSGLQVLPGGAPWMGVLAAGWTVTWLAIQLPGLGWVFAALSWVWLAPVQMYVNQMNLKAAPEHDRNSRFTAWNWVGIGFGALMIFGELLLLGGAGARG